MYDICGARSDGKVLNCPFGSPSVKVHTLAISWIIQLPAIMKLHFVIVLTLMP